jgi:excinuclease ABC subunit C
MKDTFTARIADAPQTPGVYVMSSQDGSVIYVGKSVNVRKRLVQHAAARNAGWTERTYRWIFHVADVRWHETGSELYALLLEDHLIKKYWPVGNVRQKDFLEYAWLVFTAEDIPRLLVIDARQREQFTHLFGPFHNSFYAQDMAALLVDRFRLRSCVAVRSGGCLQGEIRKCSAPCRSSEAAERHRRTITRAIDALRSNDPYFIRFIENSMKIQAQKQEYEKAAHYRTMLHRYRVFIERQEFLERFRRHGLLILEKGLWPNRFQFQQGRLVERNGERVSDDSLFGEDEGDDSRHSEWRIIDRAGVIFHWMRARGSVCEVAVIDGRFAGRLLHR